jgi:hypothetical protein
LDGGFVLCIKNEIKGVKHEEVGSSNNDFGVLFGIDRGASGN